MEGMNSMNTEEQGFEYRIGSVSEAPFGIFFRLSEIRPRSRSDRLLERSFFYKYRAFD